MTTPTAAPAPTELPLPRPGTRAYDEITRLARRGVLQLGHSAGEGLDWDVAEHPHGLLACSCGCAVRRVLPPVVSTALSGGWRVRVINTGDRINFGADLTGRPGLQVDDADTPDRTQDAGLELSDELEQRLQRRYAGIEIWPQPMLVILTGTGTSLLTDGHLAATLVQSCALGRSAGIHLLLVSAGTPLLRTWLRAELHLRIAHELDDAKTALVLGQEVPENAGGHASWVRAADNDPAPAQLYTSP